MMSPLKLLLTAICWLMIPDAGQCNKPPVFDHVEAFLTLSEASLPGLNVTWLSASDDDNSELRFSILEAPPSVHFEIKQQTPKSALVVLSSSLDRETLDQFTLTFQVSDGVNPPISQQCLVIVTDINDNPPTFVNLPNKIDLSESSPNGTLVFQVSATDRDTGTVLYELLNEQAVFHLHPVTGNITLINNLVYVVKRIYVLHVMAVDGGGLNATSDLTVNILDSRSRPPYFVHLPYSVEVFENASIGTTVIQVYAYDGATGLPGQITYSIESGDFGFFAVNSSSGWITVHKALNFSYSDVLRRNGLLEIVVKASSNSSLTNAEISNWALVTVQLIDINNHRPTFSQTTYNSTIGRSSPPNTLLMFNPKIVVSDLDTGGNGKYLIYLLQNGHSFDAFDVMPNRGEGETSVMIYLRNSELLDIERTNAFTFQIVAKEYLTSENYSNSATVSVSLVSQSSNALMFSQEEYVVQMMENPQRGQFVVKVTATIKVSNESNQRIAYSLHGSKAFLFSVNSTSGEVYVNVDAANNHTLLDRESDPVVSLMVEARTGEGLLTFAMITIFLNDKNDSPPVMINSVFYASLPENSNLFLFPVSVKATDADATGRIIYSFVRGDPKSNFAIDKYSGAISVITSVDYESLPHDSQGIINITVMAANEDDQLLNTTASLIVFVQDVNDNVPQFLRPVYFATMFENATSGYIVLNVNATDSDATSPNNLITYSILNGSLDRFLIDPDHGVITVAPGANSDSYLSQYILTVQATDRGAIPLSNRITVNITVIGGNDKSPMFAGEQRIVTVKDDATIGMPVVKASDSDAKSQLKFQFLESSFYGVDSDGHVVNDSSYLARLFAVDANTGLVTVNNALDALLVQMMSVSIIVLDANLPTSSKQSNIIYLTVFIQRVKGGVPKFLPSASSYTVHVPKSAPPGSYITRLVAVDPFQSTIPVSYRIVNSTDASDRFAITDSDNLNGIIAVKSSLQSLMTRTINLTILASIVGNSNLNSSVTLVIFIDPIQDGLRWEVFPSAVSVLENSTIGTNVTKVLALETAGQQSGQIRYFIANDVSGKFSIENSTGLLVTAGLLNARTTATYYVLIEARLGPTGIVGNLTIKVQNANSSGPKFDHQLYLAYALTNATIGTELLVARAYDIDPGSSLTYYIDRRSGNASWLFGIDPITGSVFVSSILTNVIGDLYFTVIADDRGFPPLLGSTVVRITVLDSNGSRLRIISPPENVALYVNPNQPSGQFVAQVKSEYVGSTGGQVSYFLVTTFASDWKFFTIDSRTGVITTTVTFDANSKSSYQVQVRTTDVSNNLHSDLRNLTISLRVNVMADPSFSRTQYPPPVRLSVLEGVSGVIVANVDFARKSGNDKMATCYFIIGGTEEWKNKFLLDRTSGNLWLVVSMHPSEASYVDLIIKATDDCWSGYWELDNNRNIPWNISDETTLLVRIFILGKDILQPRFSRQHFIAGILPDVQIEEPLLNLAQYTEYWGNGSRAVAYYSLGKDFRSSENLKIGIKNLNRPPFAIGQTDGILRTNSFFQDDWIGFINFDLQVGLTNQFFSDSANATVYLLNNYQRIKVTFRGAPNDVSAIRDEFTEFLSNVTGTHVGVVAIHPCKSTSSEPDPAQTDMFIYAVDPNYHIIDAMTLKNMIDKIYAGQKEAFKRFNVTEIVTVEDVVPYSQSLSDTEKSIIIAFAIVGACLILFLCLFCIIAFICHKKYKRKIKAANAIAAASGQSNGDFNGLTLPVTNALNSQGSNPAWHENFGGEFYNLSDSDSRNSSDENMKIQNSSGSQEEFFDNSENSKGNRLTKKMHYYKVNGFNESKSDSYNSDQTLNSTDQNRLRRLLPSNKNTSENGTSHANGVSLSARDLTSKSTNV